MKTVFLALPNYIATSDLLRTKYIEYLASKYLVAVLTPMIDAGIAKQRNYLQSGNIFYEKIGSVNPKFWEFFKSLRIGLVNEFDHLISIRHWYKRPNYRNNWKRRILRFFGKPFSPFLTAKVFTWLEAALLPKSQRFFELTSKYKPALVITATPGFDSWEAEIVLSAQKLSVPTIAINSSWDNPTTNAKHIRKTDYLIAWNDILKKEFIEIHHYLAEKIFVSGTPRFDPYFLDDKDDPGRDVFLRSKGLNPAYKTILHTTVTKAYPFQKKYIRDLIQLREEKKIPHVNLFIRIHPLDVYENYKEFLSIPDLCIDPAGKYIDGKVEMGYSDLLNLKYSLKYTDLNINYASTISIEACIFDKPIINIGFIDRFALAYEFNHYRPIYESGAIRLVKTDEDLPKLINLYLEKPALDREARQWVVKEYVQFTDGLSYKRSVDLLDKLIRE